MPNTNPILVRRSLEALGGLVAESDEDCLTRLRALMRVRIRRSFRPPLICSHCAEPYDTLAEYDACPFCGCGVEDPTRALVPARDRGVPVVVGKSDVETALTQIRTLSRTALKDLFEIGRILNTVYATGLWARDPVFKTGHFYEWVQRRTGYSPVGARELMVISQTFSWAQLERAKIRPAGLMAIYKTFSHIESDRLRKSGIDQTVARIAALDHPITIEEAGALAEAVLKTLGPNAARPARAIRARKTSARALSVAYEKRQRTEQLSIGDIAYCELPDGSRVRVQVTAAGIQIEHIH